jgi:hypothetical protein
MPPARCPKLLAPPREALWSRYCRCPSSISPGMGFWALDGCIKCEELAPPGSLLESGHDIRGIQELQGHKDVSTTKVHTHVPNKGGYGARSPMDEH